MALTPFKAFMSTITPFGHRLTKPSDRWLSDPVTGAIVGVECPTANGPDARFVPVDVTAAQIASPTTAMIADIDATYRLNIAPYSRYCSDGTQLVPITESSGEVIPPGQNLIFYAPWTISGTEVYVVEGQVRVQSYPA